jgi:hypothetical protein
MLLIKEQIRSNLTIPNQHPFTREPHYGYTVAYTTHPAGQSGTVLYWNSRIGARVQALQCRRRGGAVEGLSPSRPDRPTICSESAL